MRTHSKSPEALSRLTPEQHRVTQTDGTERPFANAYRDNKEPGLYVDVVSGEPLFASFDKFDSRVSEFMPQIGVEPFDLGPSAVSYVMEAGGPLWGTAVSELQLQEIVGWLSGDG